MVETIKKVPELQETNPEEIKIAPTNVKPDSWYHEYEKALNEKEFVNIPKGELRAMKEFDEQFDFYTFMERAREQEEIKFGREYYYPYHEELRNNYPDPIYLEDGEKTPEKIWITYLEVFHKGNKLPLKFYEGWRFSKNFEICSYSLNNLNGNKTLLEHCKCVVKLFEEFDLATKKEVICFTNEIKVCEKALAENYLITNQLHDLIDSIEDHIYCLIGCVDPDCCLKESDFNFEKLKKLLTCKKPSEIDFNDFSIDNEELFRLIRKNENWWNIKRDLAIYIEREKGVYVYEIADQFDLKRTTVSMILKKVSGAVNFWKGKLFETYVKKRLDQTKLFEKVELDAGSGEPDIRAYTKEGNELYVYSLKNLKIDRTPYWLETKKEIRPELESAKLCSLDYKTHLILLIYDNLHNKIKQFEIDYNNPDIPNLDLSK